MLTHEAHGGAQPPFVGGPLQGDVPHSFDQFGLAAVILETDQVLGEGAEAHHGNASACGTVALGDGHVAKQREEDGALSLEGRRCHIIRHVQTEDQLGGVGRAR